MMRGAHLLSLLLCNVGMVSYGAPTAATRYSYTLSLDKDTSPVVSILNEKGKGYTPCQYTFNPAWIAPSTGTNGTAGILVRAAKCPEAFGGAEDHILMAKCDADTGRCEDILPTKFPFEEGAQDPRVVFEEASGFYFLFYFANGQGQSTVYLRRSKTPFIPDSWERISTPQPWHRNGCSFPLTAKKEGTPWYIIVGEAPNPGLPAIGLWKSIDGFQSFIPVNKSYLPVSKDPKQPEVVVEASTPVVELSTGDFLHLYSAGTPGWVANGNYTAGWVVIDKDSPNTIIQRSETHILVASLPFEGVEPVGGYPVQRYRTTFVTSIVPIGKDKFRLYWGAADANIASGILTVVPRAQ